MKATKIGQRFFDNELRTIDMGLEVFSNFKETLFGLEFVAALTKHL